MPASDYRRGYDDAIADIYAALDSYDHPRNCGTCRACGVIRSVVEGTFMELGKQLAPEDFEAMSTLIRRLNVPGGLISSLWTLALSWTLYIRDVRARESCRLPCNASETFSMSAYSYDVEKLSIAIYTWPSSVMEGFPPVPISRRHFVQSPAKRVCDNSAWRHKEQAAGHSLFVRKQGTPSP